MNIHEYQAKELLAKYGVPVPAGFDPTKLSRPFDQHRCGTMLQVRARRH